MTIPNRTQTPRALTWRCDVCEKPVADKAGYVTVNLAAVRQYEAVNIAWESEIRARNHGHLIVSGAVAWMSMPEPPGWQVLHQKCDPRPESDDYWIGIERIRTAAHVIDWTAHLLGKNWFPTTRWSDLLYGRVLPQLKPAA